MWRRALPTLLLLALVIALVPISALIFRRLIPEARAPDFLPPKPRNTETVLEAIGPRVRERLAADWHRSGLGAAPEAITFVAIKSTRSLEAWVLRDGEYVLFREYAFTASSGEPGPKLREGDLQIPEGIYGFEYLNPNSAYHLSVKVGYPNAFDRRMAAADGRTNLGGDIMLHGKDVTIGCIPVGDPAIEEIFYLIAEAGIANCRIVIAPVDFRRAAEAPEIPGIDWEAELYASLRDAMAPFPRP